MKIVWFLLSIIFIIVLLIGCTYEKRFSIWSVYHASAWNASGDKFAFARGYHIFKSPTGMSRFPDGGTSKVLHDSISFYVFDTKSGAIQRFDHFDDAKKSNLTQFWDITIAWEGTCIIYSIKTRVWDRDIKGYREIDMGRFSFDVVNNKKEALSADDARWKRVLARRPEKDRKLIKYIMELSSKEIDTYTKNVTVEGWGLDPLEYARLSTKEYIKDLINLQGDQEYRNAVIERLGKELTYDEIKDVLEEFKEKMRKLESSDRYKYLTYKLSIEEIEERLTNILQHHEKSREAE
jgi:hypothetical protein